MPGFSVLWLKTGVAINSVSSQPYIALACLISPVLRCSRCPNFTSRFGRGSIVTNPLFFANAVAE